MRFIPACQVWRKFNDAEKLSFDYEYLVKFSPLIDIKIFFKTVLFVLMRNGVYVKRTGKKA